jgi:hypothetical protein
LVTEYELEADIQNAIEIWSEAQEVHP